MNQNYLAFKEFGQTEARTDRIWSICKVKKERLPALRAQLRKKDFPQGGSGWASRQKLHIGWILRCRCDWDIQGWRRAF